MMLIAVTVNVVWSRMMCPFVSFMFTMNVYGFFIGVRLAFTTNEPEKVSLLLLVMVHMGLLTNVPPILAPSRLKKPQRTRFPVPLPRVVPFGNENPEPETATMAPLPAKMGLSVIEGTA